MRYLLAPVLLLGCGEETIPPTEEIAEDSISISSLSPLEQFLQDHEPTKKENISATKAYGVRDVYVATAHLGEDAIKTVSLYHSHGDSDILKRTFEAEQKCRLLVTPGRHMNSRAEWKFIDKDCDGILEEGNIRKGRGAHNLEKYTPKAQELATDAYEKWSALFFANYQPPE